MLKINDYMHARHEALEASAEEQFELAVRLINAPQHSNICSWH